MLKKIKNPAIGCAIACSVFILMTQASPAALFTFRIDNAATSDGPPTDDGQAFQQQWGRAVNWILVSGEDDGDNGYPDGTDTFIMNRTGFVNNSTRLTEESAPGSLVSVAAITGTGTGNQDIVLKSRDFTIGDLVSLASPAPFTIREERDKSLTIDGVISGAGDLLLLRSGGFSDGVDDDELITITGDTPNTITGTIRLFNDNNSADNPQPSYWVADKVGAFGQAPELTLEGRAGNGGIASLRITANAVGGEGAIDDDATTVFIGAKGVLSVDAGVNEGVGEGNLFIDLLGSGTYTEIAPGTYNNSEDWIIGDGTVTVGVIVSPSFFAITEIDYAPDAEPNPTITLTWRKTGATSYRAAYSFDLGDWGSDLDDSISEDRDERTDDAEQMTVTFPLTGDQVTKLEVFFRIEEG
ncbi:MAG: hypothetical protein ACI8XO_003213 [Verrucomicrobiales bacterium]|jgi:hypothetical protein